AEQVSRHPGIRHLVLMCPAVNLIDASALESLEAIAERLRAAGIQLHLSEVKGPVMDQLRQSDVLDHFGGRVFVSHYDAVLALDREPTQGVLEAGGSGRICRRERFISPPNPATLNRVRLPNGIMKNTLAHGLLWLLGLLPTLAAWIALPAGSFDGPPAIFNSLGRLAGIAGLGLFLVAAIVSFRIPGFDRLFGGLTTLWRTHHLLGGVSFLLLLSHPLLLSLASVAVSPAAAAGVLFPPEGGASIWLGWGALVLMMVFLAPSFAFFGPPRYQRWKQVHKLAGVAAVLALAHTFILERTIPEPWSALIWAALALAALASLAYSLLF